MKVKVRIALAVDSKGAWSACGWGKSGEDADQDVQMQSACDSLEAGERRYWLEAEVEGPEDSAEVVQASVSGAAKEHEK